MRHYSPYGNRLAQLWPLASLLLLALSLALAAAVLSQLRTHILEFALTAAAIPAGFAVLLASNGYGILSPHDGRMTLRLWLAGAGALIFAAGLYVAFSMARLMEDDQWAFFISRLLPYMAVACLMGLAIIRLSTRLRRSRRSSKIVAGLGAAIAALSVVIGVWFGSRTSEDQALIGMIVGVTPFGSGMAVATYALRQAGRERAMRATGLAGAAVTATLAVTMGVWFATTAEKDYVYVVVSLALAPLALATLCWRIAVQLSPWPIWAAVAIALASVATGLWAATGQGELVDIFLFALPDVAGLVDGFALVWLAKALPSLSIALYAIFCIEEPWHWYWEWLHSRRDG
jgi:hypothetical protein